MNNESLKVVDENEWINILEKKPIPVINKNENNNEKLNEIVDNILNNNIHDSIKQDENKKEVELFTDLDENYHIEKSEKNDNSDDDDDDDNGIIKNVFIDAIKFISIAAGCKFIIEFIEWSG